MSSRNLPEWLYKALPALYVLSGLTTIFVLDHWMGRFSGAMLIFAGVSVWMMRKRGGGFNRDVPRRVDARPTAAPKQGFVELIWKEEYECGHQIVDRQHRDLFATSNALFDAIGTESKAEIEGLLNELVFDVKHHFQTEENLLVEGNLDTGGAHAALHRQLLEKANALIKKYHEGNVDAGGLISFVVYDLVAQHIAKDTEWFPK